VTVSEPTQVESDEVPEAIPVYTIFGAKGLQAPVVFLMNALEQSFTGRGSIEDGVRRAYVAVTRASEHLVISAPFYLRGPRLSTPWARGRAALPRASLVPHATSASRPSPFAPRTSDRRRNDRRPLRRSRRGGIARSQRGRLRIAD
jgi:superfamily I DNA/RNA helicase